MEQEWSTTLIPTTDAFWREKQNDRNVKSVTKAVSNDSHGHN